MNAYILGKTAPTLGRNIPEDIIARLKLCYVSANRFNPSGNVGSEDLVLGFRSPELRRIRNGSALKRWMSAAFADTA
jgi:hypothetical protein